ncbi:hypothetical protein BRAS3843_1480045 [Bradyrhizobium sp. STM 3843]|uniref:hypothetical protein n=1 Tax=Bradyrhizobium sp. STM 3843 TaxID=551947 RepID=UPI0002406BB8|nr:hypothetical protein [Bradyrhizobium sp. STM 3843]CCE05814.1 hypothetical protein BRAS3843_1480045 [Bradyrhizobium sp. STM 3843]
MSKREHDPFIFLSSRVASAGADMIERIGEIKTHMALGSSASMMAYPMEQLRQAIGEAAAALANYERVTAAGRERLTAEEFHNAARVAEGA